MGQIASPAPVLLLLAAFSRHDAALDWARRRGEETWGPVALESTRFEFRETDYYQPSMGPELRKTFWAFERMIDPVQLPDVKRTTNGWESEYAGLGRHGETRPLNLDPGYVTLGKLVLASTKDHAHRIYLSDGVYAEVTLHYTAGSWRRHEWTFPDYRRSDYQEFFSRCRDFARRRLRQSSAAGQ